MRSSGIFGVCSPKPIQIHLVSCHFLQLKKLEGKEEALSHHSLGGIRPWGNPPLSAPLCPDEPPSRFAAGSAVSSSAGLHSLSPAKQRPALSLQHRGRWPVPARLPPTTSVTHLIQLQSLAFSISLL